MKKTYITDVPNHIGAFLQASRIFAARSINITRVSYNKAVDSHMIFIEAEGEAKALAEADRELKNCADTSSAGVCGQSGCEDRSGL